MVLGSVYLLKLSCHAFKVLLLKPAPCRLLSIFVSRNAKQRFYSSVSQFVLMPEMDGIKFHIRIIPFACLFEDNYVLLL